jgi:hypothetical protein
VGVPRDALLGAPGLEVDGSEPPAPADDERRRLRDELRQRLDVGKLALGDVDEEVDVREESGEVERATVARDRDARDVRPCAASDPMNRYGPRVPTACGSATSMRVPSSNRPPRSSRTRRRRSTAPVIFTPAGH